MFDLFSVQRRNLRINEAQEFYIEKLLTDSAFISEQAQHPRHACLSTWLKPETGRRVLELGCGPGRYVALLSSLGFEVTGVDPIEFKQWPKLREQPNIKLYSGVYAEELPFEDGTFDHVSCLGALLYFNDPVKAIREMGRVMRKDGKIILRTVNRNNCYTRRTGNKLDPASKNLYTLSELISLLDANGFRVHDSFQYGYWPSILPDLYWYFVNVHIPFFIEEGLSNLLPAERRVNNIVHATKA
ncbi:MAG: class I SAM-dependent methyltransferase [Rhodospirillaceae bacterium]